MKKKSSFLLAALLIVVQAAWAQVTVKTADELLQAVTTSQTITLGADITTPSSGGRLDINNGITVTLDLNGHTLKRNISEAHPGGQAIIVETGGKLTIMDSGTDGTITGGLANGGGGIYVREGGELTITGGTISGNRAEKDANGDYGYGGAIENHGTLTITGGKISGNNAEWGGAIYNVGTATINDITISGNSALDGGGAICNVSSATLTLNGVTITGNSAQYGGGIDMWTNVTVQLLGECTITGNTAQAGGGIYQRSNGAGVNGPTLKMQDKPEVKDNTNDDVYLQSYQLITISGALSSGASIGVTTEVEQDNFTSGYRTSGNTADPSTYFHVGSSQCSGTIGWNSDNNEAKLTRTGYKYVDHTWTQSTKTLTTEVKTKANGEYTLLESNIGNWTELSGGKWYVVNGDINIGTLVVNGTGNLILCDRARLTVTGGVKVELKANAVLNIYGQAAGTGQLIVTNSYSGAAGIGSGGGSGDGNAGMINIHGGTIHATGNKYGAGIGGGDNQGFGPQANNSGLYVYGGNVTARGGEYAAGIGSGDEPTEGTAGYVAIYGGTVNATGGNEGAGIGGGNEGNGAMFSIYGGTVTAQGGNEGAGIGGGDEGHSSTTSFYGGTVTATGGRRGAGIGGGNSGYATAIEVRGGNITAIGGEQYSTVTVGGAAGIGGGYKGDCRGINFYDATQSVNGQPATVNATGKHGGAGIGSGYNSDFCRVDISGGNITATGDGTGPGIGRGYTTTGMSRQSSDKKVIVNISGGDVTAKSTNGGAGIGTGADTNFNGNISISDGKVTATGINGGAGIGTGVSNGGEKSFMYGWIVINGGEVIAQGKYDGGETLVYWSGCGAGIGSGAGGEIYPEGLIQLLGGNVTASSMSGGAIGAGGSKVNENSQRDTWVDSPIQINGNNTTLTLTSGQIRDIRIYDSYSTWTQSPVIRVHPDRGGSVSINGNLAVAMGGTISAEANRVSTLTTATESQVTVTPCTHGSCTYTINEGGSHTAHCSYCGYETTESHATTGTCVCGYNTGVTTYKVTLHTCDDVSKGYSTLQQEVVAGQSYTVPDCDDVPLGWEFVGWAETATPGTSLEQQTGETLIQPGAKRTAATTLVARYQRIEISLADTGTDNMIILNKYNLIKASSVTLNGRTLWKDGSWNTLTLPFALSNFTGTPLDGATVKTLESASLDNSNGTLTLNFSEDQTSIEAGRPYIVKWADTGSSSTGPIFSDVTIDNTHRDVVTDVVTFKGIFSPYSISGEGDNTKLYLGSDNKLYYPNGAMTIGSCRAYFQLRNDLIAGEPSSSGDAKSISQFVLNFGDGETSGIVNAEANSSLFTLHSSLSEWYDLQGRRIVRPSNGKMPKGVYINNGKKIVIK